MGSKGEWLMKITHFDPPGNVNDLDTQSRQRWSQWLSDRFDIGTASVKAFLVAQGGGTCQFYNPLTDNISGPDLPASLGDITWNGFPKRFSSTGPGDPTHFADAEPDRRAGQARLQDEYLEWFVNRNSDGKIVSIHFTCEAWDYFEFLGAAAKDELLELYQTFVSAEVIAADLFSPDGSYNRLNKWNTASGAMHLTHSANNLFAEVFLAASATVRRQQNGAELNSSIPLINCAEYGDADRNSDPNIGFAVNQLASQGRLITLSNPVGRYMASFDGNGLSLNGRPAGDFFTVVRGSFPLALRAVFQLPADLAGQGLTVSDVKIGGANVQFGGELAERITMHLTGVASVAETIHNTPVGCGGIPQVDVSPRPAAVSSLLAVAPAIRRGPTRRA
jgi:hypothetical protein